MQYTCVETYVGFPLFIFWICVLLSHSIYWRDCQGWFISISSFLKWKYRHCCFISGRISLRQEIRTHSLTAKSKSHLVLNLVTLNWGGSTALLRSVALLFDLCGRFFFSVAFTLRVIQSIFIFICPPVLVITWRFCVSKVWLQVSSLKYLNTFTKCVCFSKNTFTNLHFATLILQLNT